MSELQRRIEAVRATQAAHETEQNEKLAANVTWMRQQKEEQQALLEGFRNLAKNAADNLSQVPSDTFLYRRKRVNKKFYLPGSLNRFKNEDTLVGEGWTVLSVDVGYLGSSSRSGEGSWVNRYRGALLGRDGIVHTYTTPSSFDGPPGNVYVEPHHVIYGSMINNSDSDSVFPSEWDYSSVPEKTDSLSREYSLEGRLNLLMDHMAALVIEKS